MIYDSQHQPQLIDTVRVTAHPQFSMQGISNHRASADVALLQLANPVANVTPTPIGTPQALAAGNRFSVAGVGVFKRGDGMSSKRRPYWKANMIYRAG